MWKLPATSFSDPSKRTEEKNQSRSRLIGPPTAALISRSSVMVFASGRPASSSACVVLSLCRSAFE